MDDTIRGWAEVIRLMRRGTYSHLLLSLMVLGATYPLLRVQHWGTLVWTITLWVVLLTAVQVCSRRHEDRLLARTLFVAVFLLSAASLAFHWAVVDSDGTGLAVLVDLAMVGLHVAFFGVVGRVILFDVLGAGQVTVDKIFGAVCFYVLLGLMWAYAYILVGVVSHEPTVTVHGKEVFTGAAAGGALYTFVYYSFVTLTTLGYGDIVPVNGVTRLLAIAEALVGPLYLAILVARLVGQHLSQSGALESDSARPED